MRLEQLLMDEEVLTQSAMTEARGIADREGRCLSEVLVDMGVGEDTVADLAARAIGSLVIDVDLGALDTDAVRLIPEEDARRHLMVAVARGPQGTTLRVAFANPLDEEAVAVVRDLTGLEVDAMVATVSGLQKAIDREYKKRSTKIIRNREDRNPSEMQNEVTQQIETPPERSGGALKSSGTAPMHRLEREATIEQRHEALLLALVEAGVLTRSDYVAALKRLRDPEKQG